MAAEATTSFAPADVMTIRRLLEPLAMPLVVAWATARDFREMDRCLAGGDRAASYEEFENWNLALHRTIMAASHSPLLGQLYSVIETARHGHSWGELKRRSASRERRERYQADHAGAGRERPERQVHVEHPSPAQVVHEKAAEQRPGHTGHPE